MKEIALSIEQMKHLEELRLDTSDASMCYSAYGEDIEDYEYYDLCIGMDNNPDDEQVVIPAYTLQDIMKKLPKDIKGNFPVIYPFGDMWRGNYIGYYSDFVGLIPSSDDVYDSPLEAAYNMLCWCLENDYIK